MILTTCPFAIYSSGSLAIGAKSTKLWSSRCSLMMYKLSLPIIHILYLHLTFSYYFLIQAYALYVVAFVLGVYTNMRALENSNVETVIIFRSCTPLAVAMCDFIFLGRELPNKRSMAALLTIAAGRHETMRVYDIVLKNYNGGC